LQSAGHLLSRRCWGREPPLHAFPQVPKCGLCIAPVCLRVQQALREYLLCWRKYREAPRNPRRRPQKTDWRYDKGPRRGPYHATSGGGPEIAFALNIRLGGAHKLANMNIWRKICGATSCCEIPQI
jgi:hypothetical protein